MTSQAVMLVVAAVSCGLAGFMLAQTVIQKRKHVQARKEAMRRSGVAVKDLGDMLACEGLAAKTLEYLVGLHIRLAHGAAKPLTEWMASPKADAERRFDNICSSAGLCGEISFRTQREARVRLMVIFALIGFILGACISNELMVLLGLVGVCAGFALPRWALRQEVAARDARLKQELPEMLEVVSLGITSGLTFDRGFGLYPAYFDTLFARDCGEAHRKWTLGLTSREEALKDLADGYDSALLNRVVQNVVRSMRFGTRLSEDLAQAAADSRAEQKAARQEQIAKVPVRMMVPTACLILPAMLLLVLGPVLLELIEGF